MQYEITIAGDSPLLMHNVIAGMDDQSAANKEKQSITRKKGSNRTESDDARLRVLECYTSIWETVRGDIGIPERAIRAMIETAAKTQRQGAQVRGGLQVLRSDFTYQVDRYGEGLDKLAETAQFTVPVRVQRSTINRTRAKFDTPWGCTFQVNVDDDLVDEQQLRVWLAIGGRRVGLGDWRPATSGAYGTFTLENIQVIDE